jgi:hypothetical protein
LPALVQALKDQGADDIIVFAGGVIPAQDYDFCTTAGAKAIFGPGTRIEDSAMTVLAEIRKARSLAQRPERAALTVSAKPYDQCLCRQLWLAADQQLVDGVLSEESAGRWPRPSPLSSRRVAIISVRARQVLTRIAAAHRHGPFGSASRALPVPANRPSSSRSACI